MSKIKIVVTTVLATIVTLVIVALIGFKVFETYQKQKEKQDLQAKETKQFDEKKDEEFKMFCNGDVPFVTEYIFQVSQDSKGETLDNIRIEMRTDSRIIASQLTNDMKDKILTDAYNSNNITLKDFSEKWKNSCLNASSDEMSLWTTNRNTVEDIKLNNFCKIEVGTMANISIEFVKSHSESLETTKMMFSDVPELTESIKNKIVEDAYASSNKDSKDFVKKWILRCVEIPQDEIPKWKKTKDRMHTFCKGSSDLAKVIMKKRQSGLSISEMMEKNQTYGEVQKEADLYTISAFKVPRYDVKEYQDKAILDFSNDIYLECVKSYK